MEGMTLSLLTMMNKWNITCNFLNGQIYSLNNCVLLYICFIICIIILYLCNYFVIRNTINEIVNLRPDLHQRSLYHQFHLEEKSLNVMLIVNCSYYHLVQYPMLL